jgi:hypothetical protein
MKKIFTVFACAVFINVIAQPPSIGNPSLQTGAIGGRDREASKPKAYKDVITDKAKSKKGLFIVHKVEDKYFFEIADSLFGQEMMAVTRLSKVAGGSGKYGGEQVNSQTIRFEKGPSNNVFLRVVTLISYADSTNTISKAVKNSNVDPISNAFPIACYGKDSIGVVIDVSDFFKGDNQVVSLDAFSKRQFNLSAIAVDRSYIQNINTYPINTEIRTVKTYNSSPSMGGFSLPSSGTTLPAALSAGAVTFELNTSIILLPKMPMARRIFDSRVGYFADNFTVFADDQQKVEDQTFAVRWRLEPKPEELEKYKRGELVEPAKKIIYYVDPATPKQWVKYLIDGVNDWNIAFEQAGFKNAIEGREWPINDSTMSLEDARFSVIRYFASDIENAYGPQVHDPRSGEILESHIGWYHNVMKLVHDWYMVQTAAVDPNARKMKFDDELMGQLIRFVSSHEVGHTLGLRHNMGSSSLTPVEKLRDKAWVEANGHTVSIMDYARFNYVAQPEDKISQIGLFPRIGDYDKWAIEWGYKYTAMQDENKDKLVTNRWIIDRLKANPRLWFGGEGRNADPRAQTEDLGDNAVKASEYGIKNLKRVVASLPEWTKEEGDKFENLDEMYGQVVNQFNRYMNHVAKNIGGVQQTYKSIEQQGDVYEPTPKAIQKEALQFVCNQLLTTPDWLMDKNILNKINYPISNERVQSLQTNMVSSLLSSGRLYRLVLSNARFGNNNTYSLEEMMEDLKKKIWVELAAKKPVDMYRRNIQKQYVESLIDAANPSTPVISGLPAGFVVGASATKNTDVTSFAKGYLKSLQSEFNSAIPLIADKATKYHYQDLADRIKKAFEK